MFGVKKILSLQELLKVKNKLRTKKTVLVGGCFDLLHYGHVQFLKKAKEQGDFLTVALESDQFIKEIKKRIPIHDQKQRAKILETLDFVDLVILLPRLRTYEEYFNLVKAVRPAIIAVTAGDTQIENKTKQAKDSGAILKIVSKNIAGFSTQKIIQKLE